MRLHVTCTLLLVGLLLGGCETGRPSLPEADLDITVVGDFDRVRPVRVVVSSVDAPASLGAPLDAVRASFYRELIERRYAPFRLDLDAAAIPEDTARGMLSVRLTGWDRSRLADRGRILVSGEATLLRGGRILWKATFGSLAIRARRPEQPMTAAEKDAMAAAALGPRVLRELPVKSD
jgi:hypothetical protein